MTSTKKLQGKMKENGFTIDTLSEVIGLSKTGLFNKIHGKKEFLVSEVQSITKALSLNDSEIQDIFFASNVECNSTSDSWQGS
jgi:cyanate lyase